MEEMIIIPHHTMSVVVVRNTFRMLLIELFTSMHAKTVIQTFNNNNNNKVREIVGNGVIMEQQRERERWETDD